METSVFPFTRADSAGEDVNENKTLYLCCQRRETHEDLEGSAHIGAAGLWSGAPGLWEGKARTQGREAASSKAPGPGYRREAGPGGQGRQNRYHRLYCFK